jgi:hypothetical protein
MSIELSSRAEALHLITLHLTLANHMHPLSIAEGGLILCHDPSCDRNRMTGSVLGFFG